MGTRPRQGYNQGEVPGHPTPRLLLRKTWMRTRTLSPSASHSVSTPAFLPGCKRASHFLPYHGFFTACFFHFETMSYTMIDSSRELLHYFSLELAPGFPKLFHFRHHLQRFTQYLHHHNTVIYPPIVLIPNNFLPILKHTRNTRPKRRDCVCGCIIHPGSPKQLLESSMFIPLTHPLQLPLTHLSYEYVKALLVL